MRCKYHYKYNIFYKKKEAIIFFVPEIKAKTGNKKTQKIINNKIILCHIIQKQDGVFAHI